MLNKWQKWHYLAKIASGGFEDEKIEAYKYQDYVFCIIVKNKWRKLEVMGVQGA